MYERPPDPKKQQEVKALEAWGFSADDFRADERQPVTVWPENQRAVSVFMAMRTQWLSAPGGLIGLNYASLPEVWRRMKVPLADRDDVFCDLQVIEDAALTAMHTKDDD